MKWETTKEFYKKCWNVTMRLENNTVDYEGFLSCILNDFRMVDIKRSRVSTEEDFIRFVYTHFPLDSKAMKWAKKVIALKYYLKDKNEYIACFHRNMMAMQALGKKGYLPNVRMGHVMLYDIPDIIATIKKSGKSKACKNIK